jgi:hypothetical protein
MTTHILVFGGHVTFRAHVAKKSCTDGHGAGWLHEHAWMRQRHKVLFGRLVMEGKILNKLLVDRMFFGRMEQMVSREFFHVLPR